MLYPTNAGDCAFQCKSEILAFKLSLTAQKSVCEKKVYSCWYSSVLASTEFLSVVRMQSVILLVHVTPPCYLAVSYFILDLPI